MRLLIIFFLLSISAFTAWAQEDVESPIESSTPRQAIIDKLDESTDPETLIELRGLNETNDLSTPEPEIQLSEGVVAETSDEIDSPEEPKALAPFYLSARDYLDTRGNEEHSRMVLEYEVATSSLDSEADPRVENVQLIIGHDYVSVQSSKSQKIYDFKMNRFLEIKTVKTLANETETALHFDNTSLYAKAYRNISTVRRATQNGQKRRIPIAEDQDIDSFWLESSMSWAAAKLEKPLEIKSTKSSVLAIWDDQSVVSASFEGDTYEGEHFKNSLMAFAHHAWPIHPKILVDLYEFDTPPQSLEMLSYGPTQPKGQKQKWTLKNRDVTTGNFPLADSALSPVERRPISPLVFVISEAVENRAMNGIASPEHIEGEFELAQKSDDKIAQWLAGQKYVAYTGKCVDADESWLCAALNDLRDANQFASISEIDPNNKKLADFINAAELAKNKKDRSKALFTLQPYLDDPDAPSFILRTAAMARASMKKAEAKTSGFSGIQPEALLKQALAKDPYDPHTYLGLAQVYAANGAFEQSWDIYDTLRAAIPTVSAITLKIDQAEANLLRTGPGYFLQN